MRRLTIRVHTRSREDRVEESPHGSLEVWTRAPAVDGHANAAVCRLIAEWLKVPPSAVHVAIGTRSRSKIVEVDGE